MSNRTKNVWKWVSVFVIAAILVAGGFRMTTKEEVAKSSAVSEETYRLAEGEAADERLMGCEVYTLAGDLEQEDLCIVVKGEEYLLYVLWQ